MVVTEPNCTETDECEAGGFGDADDIDIVELVGISQVRPLDPRQACEIRERWIEIERGKRESNRVERLVDSATAKEISGKSHRW